MTATAQLHVATGLVALALGTIIVLGRKGTKRHVLIGRGFALAMLALNLSAFGIHRLYAFGPFHVAAIFSLGTLVAGYWPIWRRHPGWRDDHAYYMSWCYVGLLTGTAGEIFSRVPEWDFATSVTISCSLTVLAGAAVIHRRVPSSKRGFGRPARVSSATGLAR